MTTKEFIDFWQQCMELEYRPKTVAVGEALLLPHAIEAIGSTARNTIAESYWQPGWPYKDSITGKTSQELARDYMSKTGDQWIARLRNMPSSNGRSMR
jgi:branched-chain amino acid transport system substrate-binding protein